MGEGRLRSEPLASGVSCLALVGPFPWCVLFLGALFFLGAIYELLGQAWAEGKGKLATCCPRADSGGEPDRKMDAAIDLVET